MAGRKGKQTLLQELAVAEREVSELKLQEEDLETQAEALFASETLEEHEVSQAQEARVQGEELLQEAQAAKERFERQSQVSQWFSCRRDEAEAIAKGLKPRRPMLLLEAWMLEGVEGTWQLLGEQWLPYGQARPQATWTLQLQHLAASRPKPETRTLCYNSEAPKASWFLNLSGARLERGEFPDSGRHLVIGFEHFLFQIDHLSTLEDDGESGTNGDKEAGCERNRRKRCPKVVVEAWLWGGCETDGVQTESGNLEFWQRAFRSSQVSLKKETREDLEIGSAPQGPQASVQQKVFKSPSGKLQMARFKERFTARLHLYREDDTQLFHQPASHQERCFDTPCLGEVQIKTLDMALVFAEFAEPEEAKEPIVEPDLPAWCGGSLGSYKIYKLQIRLRICPRYACHSLQALQLSLASDSVASDFEGLESPTQWAILLGSDETKRPAAEGDSLDTSGKPSGEKMLTVKLRLPQGSERKVSEGVWKEDTKSRKSFTDLTNTKRFTFPHGDVMNLHWMPPSLWLRGDIFQGGDRISKINEELLVPVTIARFLRPLECGAHELQEYWQEAYSSAYNLEISGELESLKWCGIRTVESTISCGAFARQPEVRPEPIRCRSGAAATLMGTVLPSPDLCCFLAFTGGGGAKLTIMVFCVNQALAKMILHFIELRLILLATEKNARWRLLKVHRDCRPWLQLFVLACYWHSLDNRDGQARVEDMLLEPQ